MKLYPLVIAGALLCAALLNADTVYQNFCPSSNCPSSNYSYTAGSGLSTDAGSAVAVPFTDGLTPMSGFQYVLSGITVAAFNQFGASDPADPLTIALYSSMDE